MLLNPATSTLAFAARPRVVAHYLSQMMLALAALLLAPAAACWYYSDNAVALRHVALIAALAGLGAAGSRLRLAGAPQRNEALVVAALVFVLPPLLLIWPFHAYGIDWLDAWFEAVSALTTTGLSTLGPASELPSSLLFTRAWLQWAGGLAVVVLVLALLSHSGFAARSLGFDPGEAQDVAGGTRAHARRAIVIYLCLTAVGLVTLGWLHGDWGDAALHVLSAVSTGGFSTRDDSVSSFSLPARAALMTLCFAGAVAFYSYYRPAYRSRRTLFRDAQLKTLLFAAAAVSLLLYLTLPADLHGNRVAHALLMGFTAQTGAGFSSMPPAEAGSAAQSVMIASMLVGGSLGSTSGGIKVLRLVVLGRLLWLLFARLAAPPSARIPLRVNGTRLPRDELESMLGVVLGFLVVLGLAWFAFLLYDHAPLPALFEVSSALATAGLSSGLAAPQLQPLLKGVLGIVMLMGRVETVALIVLVMPGTWFGKRRRAI